MGGCSCSLSMFFPQMTALISFTFWSLLLRRSQALAKALKVNTTVRIISMKHNDIGTEGAKAWPVPGSNCFHGVSCFCNPLQAMPCLCQVFLTGGCSLNMLNSFRWQCQPWFLLTPWSLLLHSGPGRGFEGEQFCWSHQHETQWHWHRGS